MPVDAPEVDDDKCNKAPAKQARGVTLSKNLPTTSNHRDHRAVADARRGAAQRR